MSRTMDTQGSRSCPSSLIVSTRTVRVSCVTLSTPATPAFQRARYKASRVPSIDADLGFDPEGFGGKDLRGGKIAEGCRRSEMDDFDPSQNRCKTEPIQCAGRVMPR